jgi:hypothetical protein
MYSDGLSPVEAMAQALIEWDAPEGIWQKVLSMTINCSFNDERSPNEQTLQILSKPHKVPKAQERQVMSKSLINKYTIYPDKDDRFHVYYHDGVRDGYCISGPMGCKREYLPTLIQNHEQIENYDWTPFELPN